MTIIRVSAICIVSICFVINFSSAVGASEQRLRESAAKPIVIAHRGASGYRPEHTLAAYELAIELGADYVEPDLVPSKDGMLVARHENEISGTTDVSAHPEFASRRAKKTIDGKSMEGWFTEDFTLAELKTLRARERMPAVRQHNTIYNDRYPIPTFQEIIDLVKRKEGELHKQIGIYPEVKHPTYFASIGLANVAPLVEVLNRNGYNKPSSPIFIQCFETATLKQLKKMTKVNLVQLLADDELPYDLVAKNDPRKVEDLVNSTGLAEIATYAQGIGPSKNLLVGRDSSGKLGKPTTLVSDAHKNGLVVHPWTFRNENQFLPANYRSNDQNNDSSSAQYGNAFAEYKLYYDLGVDGVFSENPDTAIEAR